MLVSKDGEPHLGLFDMVLVVVDLVIPLRMRFRKQNKI